MANKIIIIIECDKARKNTMKSISSIKIHQKWSARERESKEIGRRKRRRRRRFSICVVRSHHAVIERHNMCLKIYFLFPNISPILMRIVSVAVDFDVVVVVVASGCHSSASCGAFFLQSLISLLFHLRFCLVWSLVLFGKILVFILTHKWERAKDTRATLRRYSASTKVLCKFCRFKFGVQHDLPSFSR